MKIKSLMDKYIYEREYQKASHTINGEYGYVRSLMRCFDHLKITDVEDLKFSDYGKIIKYYKEHTRCKNASINKYVGYLKSVFRYFKLNDHPFLLVKKMRDDVTHEKPYSNDELVEILRIAKDDKRSINTPIYGAILRLMYFTGARITEVLNIKIKDIDFNQRSILLSKTKTSKERYVFFPQNEAELIRNLIRNNDQRDYLFWNHLKKRPVIYNDMKLYIRDFKKKYGIEVLNNRKFRKTFATNLARISNDNLRTLQIILGHASIKTTQIYVDRSSAEAKDDYDKLVDKMPGYEKRA